MLPALALMLPKRWFLNDLGDFLMPVRVKLVTPKLRMIFRSGAVYLAYQMLDFSLAGYDASTKFPDYALSLLPVLPLFGLIWVYHRYVQEEQDEFQRYLFHQSILWALLGTLVLANGAGRLQADGVLLHGHSNWFRVPSTFTIFFWLQLQISLIIAAVQGIRVARQDKIQP